VPGRTRTASRLTRVTDDLPDVPGTTRSIEEVGLTVGDDGTFYASVDYSIYRLDGRQWVRIAGIGRYAPGGGVDGPATSIPLSVWFPEVTVLPDGSLVFAEEARIRRLGTDGVLRTIAGGAPGSHQDGPQDGPAIGDGRLVEPVQLRVLTDGTLAFLEGYGARRIRYLTRDGRVMTPKAGLYHVDSIAPTRDGALLALDDARRDVFRVERDGSVRKLLSPRLRAYAGDGAAASEAGWVWLSHVADTPGGILLADADDGRVRRVTPDGRIETFAGTGIRPIHGDWRPVDGPATAARISPGGLRVTAGGTVYVSSSHGLLRIDADAIPVAPYPPTCAPRSGGETPPPPAAAPPPPDGGTPPDAGGPAPSQPAPPPQPAPPGPPSGTDAPAQTPPVPAAPGPHAASSGPPSSGTDPAPPAPHAPTAAGRAQPRDAWVRGLARPRLRLASGGRRLVGITVTLPARTSLTIRCAGRTCPSERRRIAGAERARTVTVPVRLRAGTRLHLSWTRDGRTARRGTIRSNGTRPVLVF
jgi:hypothetical protein